MVSEPRIPTTHCFIHAGETCSRHHLGCSSEVGFYPSGGDVEEAIARSYGCKTWKEAKVKISTEDINGLKAAVSLPSPQLAHLFYVYPSAFTTNWQV
jgi:hypothetical protein